MTMMQSYVTPERTLSQTPFDPLPFEVFYNIIFSNILGEKDIIVGEKDIKNFELVSWTTRKKTQSLSEVWLRKMSTGLAGIADHYKQISWKELYKERSVVTTQVPPAARPE